MNIFTYIWKVIYRLPTYDSSELIAAKVCRPSFDNYGLNLNYDLYTKDTDNLTFGAITPKNDANDLLDSNKLLAKANEIYELYAK